MIYRIADVSDLPQVEYLQKKYHISTIKEEDKKDGFVTTLFNKEQFKELIEKEDGLLVAEDNGKIVAYAMVASWNYWSQWPLFKYMIDDLKNTVYLDKTLDTQNSFQYGPVCILKEYRSKGILRDLFEFQRKHYKDRYPILITFINQINTRSKRAHEKLGLDIIKTFDFNGNHYYELGYDMSKPLE